MELSHKTFTKKEVGQDIEKGLLSLQQKHTKFASMALESNLEDFPIKHRSLWQSILGSEDKTASSEEDVPAQVNESEDSLELDAHVDKNVFMSEALENNNSTELSCDKVNTDKSDSDKKAIIGSEKSIATTLGETEMILGNSKNDKAQQQQEDILPYAKPISEAPRPLSKTDMRITPPTAVIGPKIRFIGELVGEEDLMIQGNIEGTIDLKGNALIIGKQGVVKANVLAKTVTVEGRVEGDVFGEDSIYIKASSHVTGNLVAERVTLEDGAKFKGSIDMDMDLRKADLASFNQSSSIRSPAPTIDKKNIAKPSAPVASSE